MTFQDLTKELQFFVGYRILITIQTAKHRTYRGHYCTKVQYLPLIQRTPSQGNVILCNSLIGKDQIPHGTTLWAKDVHSITWHHPDSAKIQLSNKTTITIARLWKLTDEYPDKETNDQENLSQDHSHRRVRSIQHHLGHPYR